MMPGADLPIAGPQIIGAGNLDVNAGSGSNTILSISQNVTLTDPAYTGAVTLNSTSGGAAYIRGAGHTLTIDLATIEGSEVIGDDGLAIDMSGSIRANQPGKSLSLNAGNGGVINHGGSIRANGGTPRLIQYDHQ